MINRVNEIVKELARHAPTTAVESNRFSAGPQAALVPKASPVLVASGDLDVSALSPLKAINKPYEWKRKFIKDNQRMKLNSLFIIFLFGCVGCTQSPKPTSPPTTGSQNKTASVIGCDGQTYNDPATSPYVLPFAAGEAYRTGLTNCSSSFHGPGTPDQYATDFDMPEGTPFIAARAGTVYEVVEDQPSAGGGVGNYVTIDHGDNTYAKYYHSPRDGIDVAVGDEVAQGDVLGVTGHSGSAGYPHLHFIVVKDQTDFPYEGIAVSFRNAIPADVALESGAKYQAGPH